MFLISPKILLVLLAGSKATGFVNTNQRNKRDQDRSSTSPVIFSTSDASLSGRQGYRLYSTMDNNQNMQGEDWWKPRDDGKNKNKKRGLDHDRQRLEAAFRLPSPPELIPGIPASLQGQPHTYRPEVLLTSATRHFRQLELELLESLYMSEDAVDKLMNLWMREVHDAEATKTLEAMQESCSPDFVSEIETLNAMKRKHPGWAEPRVRLALILYMKEELDESYRQVREALALKPWHFECYTLLILLALKKDDFGEAVRMARQGLPGQRVNSEGNFRRRKAWIDKAIRNAAVQWEQEERYLMEQRANEDHLPSKTCSLNLNQWQ